MHLSDFNYHLPKNLIAQKPQRPRDHSRLLVLDKKTGKIQHKHFYDIAEFLNEGDLLILNNSRVIPARLIGKKKESGGKIEVFLHQKINENTWQCLLGGRGRKKGLEIEFKNDFECKIKKDNHDGTWNIEFNKNGEELTKAFEKFGNTPLPPYIKKNEEKNDKNDYQTVYADVEKKGSVAAPTAGLHFTKNLISKIKKKGVQIEYITLHVGLGTFAPVKTENIREHKMHAEYVEVRKEVLNKILKTKKNKKKVVAVGTTSARTMEALKMDTGNDFANWVNIFIYPGYDFKTVDALITNFHLPKSTLLMLVSALAGKKNIDKAYKEAIKKKYRFYSYGDAMLII